MPTADAETIARAHELVRAILADTAQQAALAELGARSLRNTGAGARNVAQTLGLIVRRHTRAQPPGVTVHYTTPVLLLAGLLLDAYLREKAEKALENDRLASIAKET